MLTDEEYECFLKALGTRVKQLRKDKNVNMRDIMIATGYYDSQWRKYESGGSMNFQSLMKIALALDVSLGELLDGLGQWPKLSVAEIQDRDRKAAGRKQLELEIDSPDSSPKRSAVPRAAGAGRSRTTSLDGAQAKRKSGK